MWLSVLWSLIKWAFFLLPACSSLCASKNSLDTFFLTNSLIVQHLRALPLFSLLAIVFLAAFGFTY